MISKLKSAVQIIVYILSPLGYRTVSENNQELWE